MTIVVGFITTREGRAAIRAAALEAGLRGASLLVLKSPSPRGSAEDIEKAETELAAILEEVQVQHEVRAMSRDGDPADDLLRVADEVKAELIVIGLRRRTPVGKLILGSNAQRVLLDATCPVLAVKGER